MRPVRAQIPCQSQPFLAALQGSCVTAFLGRCARVKLAARRVVLTKVVPGRANDLPAVLSWLAFAGSTRPSALGQEVKRGRHAVECVGAPARCRKLETAYRRVPERAISTLCAFLIPSFAAP